MKISNKIGFRKVELSHKSESLNLARWVQAKGIQKATHINTSAKPIFFVFFKKTLEDFSSLNNKFE
jgi:hypothetical protein